MSFDAAFLCLSCVVLAWFFPFLCSLCVYLLIPFSFFYILAWYVCVCCRYELFFLTMVSSFCIYPLGSNSVKHKWFQFFFFFLRYCIHVHWNLNSSVGCNSCVTLVEFFILTGRHCIRFDCSCTCCLNLYASLKIFFSGSLFQLCMYSALFVTWFSSHSANSPQTPDSRS